MSNYLEELLVKPTLQKMKSLQRPARSQAYSNDLVKVTVDPSAALSMPSTATGVLDDFLDLIRHESDRNRWPLDTIEVRGSRDPEDDTAQITVRLWMRSVSVQQSRQHHQTLGLRVDHWLRGLDENSKNIFLDSMSFQVRTLPNE